MAFSIAAGERVRDVYEAANQKNDIVVAGSAQDVGIVGWFTGGGHGPLTSTYGMGVDNVLQVTVVTPNGELVTANECLHPDLFWAIRGGGGGTFGVITKVVMKAYPSPSMQTQSFSITPMDQKNMTGFWDAAAYFFSQLPRLKEGGLSGYFFIYGPPLNAEWSLFGSLAAFDRPNDTAKSLFEPIREHMLNAPYDVNYTSSSSYSPSFFGSWNYTIGDEPVGGGGAVLGTRLLPAHSLTSQVDQLRETIRNLTTVTAFMQGHVVANSANRGLNISLNPAWRDAAVHTIIANGFQDTATPQEIQAVYDEMTHELTPQLKSLAPDSGAYFNEVGPKTLFTSPFFPPLFLPPKDPS